MIGEILTAAAPLLLAASGGLVSERAGILNIALEGFLLFGAFTTILFTLFIGSAAAAVVLSAIAALLLGLLFAWSSVSLKANVFVTGLAMNLLAPGLASSLSVLAFGTKGVINLPDHTGLAMSGAIPWRWIAAATAVIVTAVVYFVLKRTSFGLRIRVAGSDPEALRSRGVNPDRYRWVSLLISGVCASLAGSMIALDLGAFVPNMSGGRGWIALVAIYLGRKHPVGIAAACLVLASAETAAYRLQGVVEIPRTVVLAFPYLITVLGMVVFAILEQRKDRSPKTP